MTAPARDSGGRPVGAVQGRLRRTSVAEGACGILLAVYLLCGRWGLTRLSTTDSSEWQVLYEIRFWVVLLVALSVLLKQRGRSPRRRTKQRHLVEWSLCGLLAYFLLSATWSPAPDFAAVKAYEVGLVAVVTIAMAIMLAGGDWQRMGTFFWGTVLAIGGALAVVALMSAVTAVGGERLAVLGGGPNVFGRMMGYSALACLYFWRRSGYTLVFLPAVSVAALLVLLSGSRGSLVALVIATAGFVVLEVRSLRKLAALAVVMVLFSWGVLTYTDVGQAALQRYDERVQVLLLQDRYSAGRDFLYRSAYELGMSEPVWGAGLAAFPGLGLGPYPHNIFLEVFCEGGSVGLALLLLSLGLSGPRILRGRRDGAVLAGLVLSVVASQFSGDFYDSRGMFAFLLAAVSIRRDDERAGREPERASVTRIGADAASDAAADVATDTEELVRSAAGIRAYPGRRTAAARRPVPRRRMA